VSRWQTTPLRQLGETLLAAVELVTEVQLQELEQLKHSINTLTNSAALAYEMEMPVIDKTEAQQQAARELEQVLQALK
jgi:hypothetical protein